MDAAHLLGPEGPLANALPSYEPRAPQIAMAGAIQDVLDLGGTILCEAGTGTGKTLAYLIPAILSGRKVIISTGTRNLQDQIMEHDLPLLEKHLGMNFKAVCLKGLANYVCLRRYGELLSSAHSAVGKISRQLPVLERWVDQTQIGDKAELTELTEDAEIWQHVVSGTDTRIGKKCGHYEDCFVTNARREAEQADIIVVNHHLYFADLVTGIARGGHGVLPKHDAVVFDEAHRVDDVATQFFGARFASADVEKLVKDAERIFGRASQGGRLGEALQEVLTQSALLFSELPGKRNNGERAPLARFSGELSHVAIDLDTAFEVLAKASKFAAEQSDREGLGPEQIATRCIRMRNALATVSDGPSGEQITWMQSWGRRTEIGASPVDVGPHIREHILTKRVSNVFTSATLTSAGSFDYIRERMGIEGEIDEIIYDSPFDYPNQVVLYTPRGLPDPRDAGHSEAAAKEIISLVRMTDGGAFVLCTSYRSMRALAKRCSKDLDHPIYVQGDMPKGAIVSRFKEDRRAVLFATSSFWQGVDVAGEALRLVVIDKLPFAVPTEPLVRARCERMEEAGQNPFMEYLVPSAALALKQGFGRLVRRTTDTGVVAILDRRLTNKGYGKVLLKSLPECRRVDTLSDVWGALGEIDPALHDKGVFDQAKDPSARAKAAFDYGDDEQLIEDEDLF